MESIIMVQLREESRQCLWQTGSMAEQVKGIKLLGYHYIQQNQRRLLNRLTYLLLEGLVDLYANNAFIHPQSHPAQLVEDYIELLMQEKVEGRGGQGHHSDNGQKQIYKREAEEGHKRVEELLSKNTQLKESVRLLEEKSGKQGKIISKMKQKYSAISELMFEIKQNHEKEIQNLIDLHTEEVQTLNGRIAVLNEELIRTKTRLEMLQSQKDTLCYPPRQENECSLSSCQTQMTAGSSNDARMAICSISSFQYAPKEIILLIRKEMSWHIEPVSKQISYYHVLDQCLVPSPITKQNQQSQTTHLKTQISDCDSQTQLTTLDLATQEEKHSQLQQQLSTLSIICDQAKRQSQSARLKFAIRDEEYIQLARHYNNLQETHEREGQDWRKQKEQGQSIIKSLKEEVQRLSLLNQQMEQNMLQVSNNSHSQLRQEKEQTIGSSCDHTDQSTTPRKRQDSLPLSHISDFIQPSLDQSYIRKDTISKYLLQLLDKNCRGEETLIIIEQISSCLDWQQEQTEKIRQYGRKSRLKESPPVEDEGLQSRFFRFLTEQ